LAEELATEVQSGKVVNTGEAPKSSCGSVSQWSKSELRLKVKIICFSVTWGMLFDAPVAHIWVCLHLNQERKYSFLVIC